MIKSGHNWILWARHEAHNTLQQPSPINRQCFDRVGSGRPNGSLHEQREGKSFFTRQWRLIWPISRHRDCFPLRLRIRITERFDSSAMGRSRCASRSAEEDDHGLRFESRCPISIASFNPFDCADYSFGRINRWLFHDYFSNYVIRGVYIGVSGYLWYRVIDCWRLVR